MRKKYFLQYFKVEAAVQKQKAGVKFRTGVRCYLYRKNGKFKISHRIEDAQLMNFFVAFFWYKVIQSMGRTSKRLFAYKFPAGLVTIGKK